LERLEVLDEELREADAEDSTEGNTLVMRKGRKGRMLCTTLMMPQHDIFAA
jgi:hypothetical protein